MSKTFSINNNHSAPDRNIFSNHQLQGQQVKVSINTVEDDITDFDEDRFYSNSLIGGSSHGFNQDDEETVRKYAINSDSIILNHSEHLFPHDSLIISHSSRLVQKENVIPQKDAGPFDRDEEDGDEMYNQLTSLSHPLSPTPAKNTNKIQLKTMLTVNQQFNSINSTSNQKQNQEPRQLRKMDSVEDTKKFKNSSSKQTETQATQEGFEKQSSLRSNRSQPLESVKLESKNQMSNSQELNYRSNPNDSLQNSSSNSNNNTQDDDSNKNERQSQRRSIKKMKNRTDVYGNKIRRGGKKHKVVFADHKQLGKPLYEVHVVESFKRYNTDMSSRGTNKACCLIF